MSKTILQTAMTAMGHNPEMQIPLANEENQNLLKELEELMEEKTLLSEELKQIDERTERLKFHCKHSEQDLNANMKLLIALQTDVQTEEGMCKVADREQSKLTQDIKNMVKEIDTQDTYLKNTENEMEKRKKNMDDLTNRIQWAKTVLAEWQEAMQDSNKGFRLIEKYFHDDEQMARQKELRRQSLQQEIEKSRKELVMLNDEEKSLELHLQCISKLYREAHAERRHLVDTWKAAVHQMTQRERDIENGENELSELKLKSEALAAKQKQYDDELNKIIQNNREIEVTIEELNKDTSEIKEEIQQMADMMILKENEVEILQKDLQNLTNMVEQQRLENRQLEKERKQKLEVLGNFDEVLRKLNERYAAMESKNMNAQQRLQILEDMMDSEQRAQAQLTADIKRINELKYRAEQQLAELTSEEKTLQVENQGIIANTQAVKRNLKKAAQELHRQTEVHYELGFKLLQLERRLIKVQGAVLDPEGEQKNLEYLAELEEKYAQMQKRLQAAEAQNKKLDYNMRNLTHVFNEDGHKLEELNHKIKEAQLYGEGGLKRLKSETNASQVLIVELSILKIRVSEFEDEIDKCKNRTFTLENHRIRLNRTIKDRMVELKSQTELLNLKRKHILEEQSTLRADIGDRTKHIQVVMARLELATKLLGCNDDGSMVTATQLKVQLAQEKEMLVQEGDELNNQVLKAEEEVKALENTVHVLNSSNDAYRSNFLKVEDNNVLVNELKNLELEHCESTKKLAHLRNQVLRMERKNEEATKLKQKLERNLEAAMKQRETNQEILKKQQKELLDQNVKLERAERDIRLAIKAAKQRGITSDALSIYDMELDLRDLENRNMKALNKLIELAESEEKFSCSVTRLLTERDIHMPHLLQRTRSLASLSSDTSEMSRSSFSRDLQHYAKRITGASSSESDNASAKVSVVSIDFPGP